MKNGGMLQKMRTHIDAIDDDLVRLLIKRSKMVMKLGAYKKKNGMPMVDSKREIEIKNKVLVAHQKNKGLMADRDVAVIFKQIILASRRLQKN